MNPLGQSGAPLMIAQPVPQTQIPPEFYFLLGVELIIAFIVSIFVIAGMWKIFVKAGRPGWAAIIPFYNIYILLLIVGKPGWWIFLYFVPLVNIVIPIIVSLELAKRFGRSEAFGFFLLYFLQPVGIMMLGFGKSKYMGNPSAPTPTQPKPSEAAK